MRFENPNILFLLLSLPLWLGFFFWAMGSRRRALGKFLRWEMLERFAVGASLSRWKWQAVLTLFAMVAMVLALARPQWGFEWEEVNRRGVDIVIAVDVSKSMLAEDIKPNRLKRASREIYDFLRIIQGDRVGLIVFAGRAFVQSPLTLDFGILEMFLEELGPEMISVQGTALDEAVEMAIPMFSKSGKRSRALIIITDGEDHSENTLKAAEEAGQAGIKIFTVGVGSTSGAPIPRAEGGFIKDRKGEMVLSRLNEGPLQEMALSTGGSYVRSVSGDMDLERIYSDVQGKLEDEELTGGRRKNYHERFQWPLGLGFLLLLLEWLIRHRKTSGWGLKTLLLGLLCLSAPVARADINKDFQSGEYKKTLEQLLERQVENPDDPSIAYNLGNTFYRMGDFKNAEKQFHRAAEQSEEVPELKDLAQRSRYNEGNAAFKQGDFKKSIEAYQKSLSLISTDEDAKHNLAVAKKRLEEQPPQENKKSDKNDSEEKDPKDDKNSEKDSSDHNQSDQTQNSENQQKSQENSSQSEEEERKPSPESEESSQDQEKQDQEASPSKADEPSADDAQKNTEQKTGENPEEMGKMTETEARQWLSRIKENRSKFRKLPPQRPGQAEKDW